MYPPFAAPLCPAALPPGIVNSCAPAGLYPCSAPLLLSMYTLPAASTIGEALLPTATLPVPLKLVCSAPVATFSA